MQHQATICPEHGRAVSCTGPDDADILFGQCDWGNHSVDTVSNKYIADHRAGNVRELDYDAARADHAGGTTVSTQAAVSAPSELETEFAKLPADEREQLLSAVKAANAQRDVDAATVTGDVEADGGDAMLKAPRFDPTAPHPDARHDGEPGLVYPSYDEHKAAFDAGLQKYAPAASDYPNTASA